MKSKSKKQVPKVRLPKFTLGGSNSYNEGLPSTLQTGTNTQTGNSTTDYMNDKRTGKSKMDTATKYAGYATTAIGGISDLSNIYNNNGTPNDAYKSARSTENSIVSNVPVYGAIHSLTGSVVDAASASTLAGKTDDKGNLVSRSETKADMVGKAFADPFAMIAARGAYEGGWTDFSGNAYADSLEKKAKEQVASNKAIQDSQQKQQDDYNKMYNYYQQQQGLPQAKYGGQMMFAMGGMNKYPGGGMGEGNSQVENDENSVAPNGQFTQFNEPPHSQQNPNQPNASLAQGEKIFSAKLKLGKKTFAELNKPNNTNREDKLATKDNLDPKSRISLALTKMAKMKNSDMLFAMQEQLKKDKVQAYAQKMGVQLPSMDNEQAEPQGMSEQSEGEMPIARYGGRFAMGGVQLPYYNTDNNGNPTYANGGSYPAMTNPYHKFKGRIPAYGGGGQYVNGVWVEDNQPTEGFQTDAWQQPSGPVNNVGENSNVNNLITNEDFNKFKDYTQSQSQKIIENQSNKNSVELANLNKKNLADSYIGKSKYLPNNNSNLNQSYKGNPNPESDKINWGDVAGNVGNFAAQNAGNIYDLMRKDAPLTTYERASASYLDPSAAMRAADQENRRAEWGVRNASGGNAGTYLSNRVALGTQNTMNKAQIAQQYANANAQVGNQNAQFNAEIAYREREARDKDAAMKQNINSMAIHNIGSSFGKSTKSGKQDEMDQDTLDLYKEYYNNPQFRAAMKKSTFGSKKSTTKNKKD